MEIFKISSSKKKELERILNIDDISRLSITIRDSSILGKEGFQYIILEGPEERLRTAREEFKSISEKIENDEKDKIKDYIEKERDSVYNGLGSIFG
ncbi:MAG: hypothetical protein ACP5RG_03380 [Thermoplasmata archaeon]